LYVKLELRALTKSHGMRDRGDDLLDDPVGEIFLLRVAAHVGEGQHSDRWLVGERQRLGQGWYLLPDRGGTISDPVDPHRPGDVLDLLLAQILERAIKPIPDLIAHNPADADPAGLGQRLQTRRDVHPIAEDVFPSAMTSPRLIPMRNSIRSSGPVA
jgi:hypothetical protein